MNTEKREYELTEDEIGNLFNGGSDGVGRAWILLGKKYGFDPETVESTEGKKILAMPVDVKPNEVAEAILDSLEAGRPATEDMFTSTTINDRIGALAEAVATEMDAVDKLKKEHTRRKDALDAEKERLSNMLTDAGMKSCALECGLTPIAKVNRKYFKAQGVDDPMLHGWLRSHELGGIIIPYVHYGTLQSTLKDYEGMGGEIDDSVFNVSNVPSVTMRGKTAYLAGKGV